MTGWRYFLMNFLWWMWLLYPLVYAAYLLSTAVRRRRGKPRDAVYWSRSAAFHGRWGVVLAVPGLTISIIGGLGYVWEWVALPALIGTLASCVLADLAMREIRFPTPLAFLPLGIVIVSVHIFSAYAGMEGPAVEWAREDHSSIEMYFRELLLQSNYGFALVAWVAVAVNFALSIRRVNRLTSATPVERAPVATRGFVWPH